MQRNANVGSKLLALIAVPAVVLVAVASVGALQRVDDKAEADRTESGARRAASTTDLAHQLQVERLLTARLVSGDQEVAAALDEARTATDQAAAIFSQPDASVGEDATVASRFEAAIASTQQVVDIRPSIDDGSTDDVALVLDTYTSAVEAMIELEQLAVHPQRPARADRDPQRQRDPGSGQGGPGPAPGADRRHRRGPPVRGRGLRAPRRARGRGGAPVARLEESQDETMTNSLGNTMAEPAVREHDALMEQVMAEGVIGGSGRPGVAPQQWQTSSIGWLDSVHGAEGTTLDATIAHAEAAAFEADKSARLYLIGTAAAVILSILLASLLARRINRRLQRLTVGGQPAGDRRAAPPGRGPALARRAADPDRGASPRSRSTRTTRSASWPRPSTPSSR